MTSHRNKSDATFLLEGAAWPAFLVDGGGTIRHANKAAINFFGPILESDSTALAAILSSDNHLPAEQFLAAWERTNPAVLPLKFRGKGAIVNTFSTCICAVSREAEKRFIFQLFRENPTSSPPREMGSDTVIVHRQKLDCAMQLARTMALDFNNALTSVLGHTSLVLSQMEPAHPWRTSLIEVEKAAQRAAEMAQHLATFSRPEPQSGPTGAPGNLNRLLRRLVTMYQQATGPRIDWALELEEHLFAAPFDEGKIQQALVNILENAVEAAGQFGRVQVRSHNLELAAPLRDGTAQLEPGCYVCAEVKDGGTGIDPANLPRIFEPFFTTKSGHRGLGLAWVYGAVSNHGGGVGVTSQPPGGTCVRVYLPASKRLLVDHAVPDGAAGKGQTVLLVDDEEPLLSLGKSILEACGYRVLTAVSAAQALEVFGRDAQQINLLVTDLVMPQMSGRELIERVRTIAPRVPILCTSGLARTGTDPEAFLRKPYTSQELLSRVKEALRKT